jgi:hypothetical protein
MRTAIPRSSSGNGNSRSLRRTKYIYDLARDETSVFDLEHDPGEQADVSAKIPAAEIDQAGAALRAWQTRVRHAF